MGYHAESDLVKGYTAQKLLKNFKVRIGTSEIFGSC